jgi:tetratricopeptide (TPR) repeat protein
VYSAVGDQIFNRMDPVEKTAAGLLPRDVPNFTDRAEELGRLAALVGGGSAVVTAIGGTAGVGKTALAVHVAHQLVDQFPGGHLYADLRGYTEGQAPAEPGEVLDLFLRSLGMAPEVLPADMEQRSGKLRQLLATRPVLMVLDNAATDAQVQPLLPGAGASLVLITSRSALAAMDLDDRIDLDVLPVAEAVALLAELIGQDRAGIEPEATEQVAQLCGCLPLALRIAGRLLALHKSWLVSRLAGMLAVEGQRLDLLAVGDRQVRAAFQASYSQLADTDARMFRLLGLHPGADFDRFMAAALAGMSADAAEDILNRLARAYLINEGAGDRYRMHDLLRLFARETSEARDDDTTRNQATAGLLEHFTRRANFLDACLNPRLRPSLAQAASLGGEEFPAPREALALFEAERRNLLAAITLAADQKQYQRVWQLDEPIAHPLMLLRHLDDALTAHNAALTGARATGDAAAEAGALNRLGSVYSELRRYHDAMASHEEALAIFRDLRDRSAESQVLTDLGVAYAGLERYDEALTIYQQGLLIRDQLNDRYGLGQILGNIGIAYSQVGSYDDAIAKNREALTIFQEFGDRRSEGQIRNNLAGVYAELGRYEDAISSCEQDAAICREFGDRHGEGVDLYNLGFVYAEMGRYDRAITCYNGATDALNETGDLDLAALASADLVALQEKHRRGRSWWRRHNMRVSARPRSDPKG